MYKEQKIKMDETQIKFIKAFKNYGFNSEDELVNYAIELFQKKVENQIELEKSAELYAEVYKNDAETQVWIDSAISDWK